MPSASIIRKVCVSGTNQPVFIQLNKDEAECFLCKAKLKTTNGNTKGLATHLKTIHNDSDEWRVETAVKYGKCERTATKNAKICECD
jgi:hypothetical protein